MATDTHEHKWQFMGPGWGPSDPSVAVSKAKIWLLYGCTCGERERREPTNPPFLTPPKKVPDGE